MHYELFRICFGNDTAMQNKKNPSMRRFARKAIILKSYKIGATRKACSSNQAISPTHYIPANPCDIVHILLFFDTLV